MSRGSGMCKGVCAGMLPEEGMYIKRGPLPLCALQVAVCVCVFRNRRCPGAADHAE